MIGHDDWWLREASFNALAGLEKDDAMLLKVLPTMLEMMVAEYHTMPRQRMVNQLNQILQRKKQESKIGQMIMAGHQRAVKESKIKDGDYAAEGAYNISHSIDKCLRLTPESAVAIALMMKARFDILGTGAIIKLVATPNSNRGNKPYGLYSTLDKQSPEQKKLLTELLCNDYRQELVKRMKASDKADPALVDTIVDLTKLKNPNAGWVAIGATQPSDRVWRYTSFDPKQEKDIKHPRERRRFRNVTLPKELEGWNAPDFDDSQWMSGKAPIGKGLFQRGKTTFENHSEWGAGEFLVMRTTFKLDKLEHDSYRISVLANQGFNLYLNGHKIHSYGWWKDKPYYSLIGLTEGQAKHLKQGANHLAVYAGSEYPHAMDANKKEKEIGQMDIYLEGLKNADLE
tara:strand:+ start:179 stop:1378 length:1200 start_codon:yes stop_codon:yes gene_type:complete